MRRLCLIGRRRHIRRLRHGRRRTHRASLRYEVIARSPARGDEAIQRLSPAPGLLRGAWHRVGHFGPDPLARNDEVTMI
jgi:hypothetical protein